MVSADAYSSNLTPSQGTTICLGGGPKKPKTKNRNPCVKLLGSESVPVGRELWSLFLHAQLSASSRWDVLWGLKKVGPERARVTPSN